VIVWRARWKSIRSVLCSIVCNNCTQRTAHIWTEPTVLWIGFCLTGPISLCVDSFLCNLPNVDRFSTFFHRWICSKLAIKDRLHTYIGTSLHYVVKCWRWKSSWSGTEWNELPCKTRPVKTQCWKIFVQWCYFHIVHWQKGIYSGRIPKKTQGWLVGWSLTSIFSPNTAISETKNHKTRHRASASMYSLAFRVRVMLS